MDGQPAAAQLWAVLWNLQAMTKVKRSLTYQGEGTGGSI